MHSSELMRVLTCWLTALLMLSGWLSAAPRTSLADPGLKGIEPLADLQRLFQNPPDDSRIMMRWWWFGPAVAGAELEREMRLMKEGGIGGFEVQPVYPVVLDDPANGITTKPFLSDEFIEALRFASGKARELGLRFDLTLGSGWPYGGPTVSIEHAAARLRYERVKIEPDSKFVKVPSIGAGEKLIAAFLTRTDGKSVV